MRERERARTTDYRCWNIDCCVRIALVNVSAAAAAVLLVVMVAVLKQTIPANLLASRTHT